MYLAIDIGGTKTLIAIYSESGELVSKEKVVTPHDYDEFMSSIRDYFANVSYDIKSCVMGVPGLLDRQKGIVHALGNLPWRDKPIGNDVSQIIGGKPVKLENDSRL